MQFVDNILWIEFTDFLAAGFKEDTIKKANLRNGPYWIMMRNPRDARRPMVQYDTLRQEHKDRLTAHYGDVYQYMAQQPILAMLQPDDKADAWYRDYTYDGPEGPKTHLSDEHIAMCTARARWCNLLTTIKPKEVRELTGLREMPLFYGYVITLANGQGARFPKNYSSLMGMVRQYQQQGYAALLPPRLGNRNSLKVADDTSRAVLLQLLSDPRQHDDVFVARAYNTWAQANGYEPITDGNVGLWRRRHAHLIGMDREGNAAWRNKYGMVIKGRRPSSPLLMWEHDDNHLDLLYNNDGYKYQRVRGIFVTDSYCDYVLGYWITAGELKPSHVRMAYLMALHHLHSLTGGWYVPFEVKSDRWNLKQLLPFYEKIGHYQRSTVGGSRGRGYIEQFFGTADWGNCLKAGANNYNGHNLTARTTGINTEWMDNERSNRPLLADAPDQVAEFVERLRHMPGKDGKSRQQRFLEAFGQMPAERRRCIAHDQMLSIFGIPHNAQDRPVSITNKGVEVQINKQRLLYSIPPAMLLANIGKKVTVQYDPLNMEQVLLTDNDRLRIVATRNHGVARAMADYEPGHREMLNSLMEAQKAMVAEVVEAGEKRRRILDAKGIDAVALLKGNVQDKWLKQLAEEAYEVGPLPYAGVVGEDTNHGAGVVREDTNHGGKDTNHGDTNHGDSEAVPVAGGGWMDAMDNEDFNSFDTM